MRDYAAKARAGGQLVAGNVAERGGDQMSGYQFLIVVALFLALLGLAAGGLIQMFARDIKIEPRRNTRTPRTTKKAG